MKYPKPRADTGLDLIRMFLQWPPDGRCTVQQSLDHSLLWEFFDFAAALRACSHGQLGKLVVDSIRRGVPVSSADILAAGAPVTPRRKKRSRNKVGGDTETEEDASPQEKSRKGIVDDADIRIKTSPISEQQTDCLHGRSATTPAFVGSMNAASGVHNLMCACRGQCRQTSCVKACNAADARKRRNPDSVDRKKVQICDQLCLPGFRYCSRCRCEVATCTRGRDKSHSISGR